MPEIINPEQIHFRIEAETVGELLKHARDAMKSGNHNHIIGSITAIDKFLKGRRDSARVAEKFLNALRDDLVGREFEIDGKKVKIKLFSDVKKDDETGKPELGFDIVGMFGHVEFFVKQTGWGS